MVKLNRLRQYQLFCLTRSRKQASKQANKHGRSDAVDVRCLQTEHEQKSAKVCRAHAAPESVLNFKSLARAETLSSYAEPATGYVKQ